MSVCRVPCCTMLTIKVKSWACHFFSFATHTSVPPKVVRYKSHAVSSCASRGMYRSMPAPQLSKSWRVSLSSYIWYEKPCTQAQNHPTSLRVGISQPTMQVIHLYYFSPDPRPLVPAVRGPAQTHKKGLRGASPSHAPVASDATLGLRLPPSCEPLIQSLPHRWRGQAPTLTRTEPLLEHTTLRQEHFTTR